MDYKARWLNAREFVPKHSRADNASTTHSTTTSTLMRRTINSDLEYQQRWLQAPEFVPTFIRRWLDAPEFVPSLPSGFMDESLSSSETVQRDNQISNITSPGQSEPNGSEDQLSEDFQSPGNGASSLQLTADEFEPNAMLFESSPTCTSIRRSLKQPVLNDREFEQHGMLFRIPATVAEAESQLCIYFKMNQCRYGDSCVDVHGELCDFCNVHCMHPVFKEHQRQHVRECMETHELDMASSFIFQESRRKTCGICLEVVWDKPFYGQQRFGIMSSCVHCFCIGCIREWRKSDTYQNCMSKTCPECRIVSDFVCPSRFWVNTPETRQNLFEKYRKEMRLKTCRLFEDKFCPFGDNCFYNHPRKPNRTSSPIPLPDEDSTGSSLAFSESL